MKRLIVLLLTILSVGFLFIGNPTNTTAAIYGDDDTIVTEGLVVDKKVAKPINRNGNIEYDYYDNVSINDHRFQPGDEVRFHITVKNTSNLELTNITLKDYIPAYVEPVEGPGTFNVNDRVITHVIPSLAAGEEKTYELRMQIVSTGELPAGENLISQQNHVEISLDGLFDQDSAQFHIEKRTDEDSTTGTDNDTVIKPGREGVTGVDNMPATGGKTTVENVKKIPNTGPEFGLLVLLGGAAGIGLGRRLTKTKRRV